LHYITTKNELPTAYHGTFLLQLPASPYFCFMKALVIRFSSIGDIVLTTPVVRCLKQQRKDITIHFLTKKPFETLLRQNPYIDRLHLLGDNLNDIITELKQENFDVVIDLHNNARTMRVKMALNAPAYSYPKLNIRKWLSVNLKINLLPDKSIVDRYFETVKALDVTNDGKGLDFFLDPATQLKNTDIPMSHWAGYAAFVIGGSYFTKQLPVPQWIKLCNEIPFPVILLGSKDEQAAGDEISASNPARIYNSCGKFSLNESAELVKNARIVVSNDTGLMHIAAAFGKPLVSLWGNTTPEMGMFPYYGNNNLISRKSNKSIIIENKDLGCRPCSKLGYKKCPAGHFKCMNNLNMSEAAAAVSELWNVC
jgi:ADP-heptose:LPS heptosyltransferase